MDLWLNSKSGEPQCVPWRALSDWGQSRKKELQEALPHGEVDPHVLCWPERLWLCYGLSHSDQFLNPPHVPPAHERIKKRQMCPHFHQSRKGRERHSLVSFPLRHFVMWNIAPLHHMPQQISWGTIPMTVVVNSMKASHKTAPSSWCDRNIL